MLELVDLRTADHHQASLRAELSIRLVDPELFVANLFRDRVRFSLDQLNTFLAGEIRQALRELAALFDADELCAGVEAGSVEACS